LYLYLVLKPSMQCQGNDFTYPVAIDTGTITKSFGVNGIPSAFVLDVSGKVIWQG